MEAVGTEGAKRAARPPAVLLDDATGRVALWQSFVGAVEARVWMNSLLTGGDVRFQQCAVRVWGRHVAQPRLVAFVAATPALSYTYSGLCLHAEVWPSWLAVLCARVNDVLHTSFNSCLLNYYRNGRDHIGWHSDNERELGEDRCVAGVSLGARRRLLFKPRPGATTAGARRLEIALDSGSLYAMSGAVQGNYMHCVPKAAGVAGARVSLTFRRIIGATAP